MQTPLWKLKHLFKYTITIEKNHGILELKQKSYLKPYIECNIELQREAEKEGNKIKKQNAKLRNSGIFGRSIENPINKIDVKTATTGKQYLKW